MNVLPRGVVTFLLTDVEGSTRLWEGQHVAVRHVLARHEEIIRECVTRHGGVLVKNRGEGDSTFSVFAGANDAACAAVETQRHLRREAWSEGIELRVRMALHTGEASLHEGDYLGQAVNRCARLRSLAHGGQIVVTAATAELIQDAPPPGARLRSLGLQRLKDLSRPEHVFQLEHPALPAEFPPLRGTTAFVNNLPVQRTAFVGREEAIRRVCDLLGQRRMVTLTGVGGCGKTRLAVACATAASARFPGGVMFVDLAVVSDPGRVWVALGSAIGAVGGAVGASSRPVQEDALSALRDRAALLLLDNCEHLIDACAELADAVLSECAGVTILATSREALGVDGEQTFPVKSLELPGPDKPDASESMELFVDRARAVRPDFRLDAGTRQAVIEICRRLDGIPLAIELAAARVALLSPRQIADRLNERFRLLVGPRRRIQRQQTLRAAMDWSFDLLSDVERMLLRRLAVFPGSFDLAAVEAVCGAGPDTLAVLGSLVARSLVGLSDEHPETRYRLLETMRMYAEERLADAGESDLIRRAHRDHYLAVATSIPLEDAWFWATSELTSPALLDNLQAAVDSAASEERFDIVAAIVSRAVVAWAWTEHHELATRWLRAALDHEADLDPELRSEVLGAGSLAALTTLDPVAERLYTLRAMEPGAAVASGPLVVAMAVRSCFESVRGDLDEGVRLAEGAVAVARDGGLPSVWTAWGLWALGGALALRGDYAAAEMACVEASERSDSRASGAWLGLVGRALIYHLTGQTEQALDVAERLRRTADGLRELFTQGPWVMCTCALAIAYAGTGAHDRAEAELAATLVDLRHISFPGMFELCVGTFACIAAMRGEFERASRLFAGSMGMTRNHVFIAVYRHYVAIVRRALDAATVRRCRAEGAAMSRDDALALALRADPESKRPGRECGGTTVRVS